MSTFELLDPVNGSVVLTKTFDPPSQFYDFLCMMRLAFDFDPHTQHFREFVEEHGLPVEWCDPLAKIFNLEDQPNTTNYYLEDYIDEIYAVGYYSDQRYLIMRRKGVLAGASTPLQSPDPPGL
jgi:hypothetical protein